MRILVIVLLVTIMVGCVDSDIAKLPNGYEVFAANPREIYVANDKNELLVGFAIRRIGVEENVIFVECVDLSMAINGFQNMSGFSIIYTDTGQVDTNLNRTEFRKRAGRLGFSISEFRPVSDYF